MIIIVINVFFVNSYFWFESLKKLVVDIVKYMKKVGYI